MKEIVEKEREKLVERIVEIDDELAEKYLNGEEISVDSIKRIAHPVFQRK